MAFIPAPHAASKPDRKQITISNGTANYNLANDLSNNHGWNGTSPIDVEVTVDPSVHVYATATTTPAFVADLVSGSKLTLINNGVIAGKGGAAGSPGGHAISLKDVDATVVNVPGENLMLRSQLFNSGSWGKVGSPTVDADVTSVNTIKNSEAFDNWTAGSSPVVTANSIANPLDSDKTADTIAGTYTYSSLREVNITLTASTDHTLSVYFKPNTSVKHRIGIYDVSASLWLFEVQTAWSNGVPSTSGGTNIASTTIAYTDVGNGWWRMSMTATTSSNTNYSVYFYPSYGANGQSLYAYGAQLEQGTVASAYEETGATANPPIASPIDGIQSVERITRTTTASTYLSTGNNIGKASIAQTFTSSIYARRSVGDYFAMRLKYYPSEGGAIFNLKTGKVHSTSQSGFTNTSAQIESVGGGFYRCVVTSTTTATPHAITDFSFSSNGVGVEGTDSALSSGYVWGFQCELTPQRNYYSNPEDLSVSPWGYALTVTPYAAVNPVDGAQTATKVERNSSTNGAKREQTIYLGTGNAGKTFIHSVYIKNINATQSGLRTWDINDGSFLGTVHINWGGTNSAVPTLVANGSASNATARDVGNGWWRVSYEQTPRSGSNGHASGIVAEFTSANLGVYVYGFQFEKITANGEPSPYIPVSRNLLDYPETPSKFFTTNQTGTITENYTIAPDGTMTAALLADNSTTVGALMQRNLVVANDSAEYTWSFYIKKDNDVSRFPLFWMNFYGGTQLTNYVTMNTQTGAINTFYGNTRLTYTVVSVGDYWRVSFTTANNSTGNTGMSLRIDPAKLDVITNDWTHAIASMTGSIVIWGQQLEVGTKNLVTHPEELDNAAWVKVGSPVVTANANSVNINPYSENAKLNYTTVSASNYPTIGAVMVDNVAAAPDGKFTADRIEDTSTSYTRYTQKNLTIPANTGTWTWSFYILKDSNTSRFPLFVVGLHGGGLGNQHRYCWFNTSTGAVQNGALNGANPLTSVVVESVGDYWRLALTATNNGQNNLIYHQVFPAHAASLGGNAPGTLTGSVVFAHSQVQAGSTASVYEPKLTNSTARILAPNGTQTAEYFARTSATDGRSYQSLNNVKSATPETFTFSMYAKRSIGNWFAMRVQSSWPARSEATFNIATGVVESHYNTVFSDTSAKIEDVGNGWYRCSITFTTDTGTSLFPVFSFNNHNGSASSSDNIANSSGYVWGAQVERGHLTDYEEASGYIAIGNKATRYRYRNMGVTSYTDRDAKIYAGGGGGGAGGSVTGHGSTVDTEGDCGSGTSHAGGSGGTGAGPATTGAGAGTAGSSPAADGGSGGTWGQPGFSGGSGGGTGCNASNGGGGAGGAAGKAIHLVSNASLTLRNTGEILGATS